MLRSMFSSIAGLRAHQTMMDVTGNNIANVNTTGYKSAQTLFQDTLSQILQAAGAPSGQLGGTNPAQVGLGTRVAAITTTFTQGASQTTGRSTDLMISGDGFFVTEKAGQQLYTRAGAFSFDAAGNLVTQDGAFVQGWTAVGGAIDTTGPVGGIRLPLGTLLPPVATTTTTATGNLPADAATGTVLTTTIPTYDATGNERTLTVAFTKTANPGEWSATVDLDTTPATATVNVAAFTVPPAAGTVTIAGIDVDLSALTMYAGTSSAALTSQDGSEVGSLAAFTVGNDGTLTGVFSNGLRQDLGRVAVAAFNNPQGLEKVGNTAFRDTVNSGIAQIGTAGTGARGTLQGGSLEMSNVDLSSEFTNLIISQRGFQANSRVITASDELLQDLVNMKR
jgi:flagellar hook protein FlgE